MAFDETQPTDTTKIRNLGVVIRPNWEAIVEGDSTFQPWATNYASRTPLAVTNDPTAIEHAYILYSKDDASGVSQLYGIDENSVITQFTNGAQQTGINGYSSLHGGMKIQWGYGNISNGGEVNPSQLSTIYSVQAVMDDSSASPTKRLYVYDVNGTPGRFKLRIAGAASSLVYWLAIGA